MLKVRLIPKLQLRKSKNIASRMVLVITKQFNEAIEIGDPVSQAKIYEAQAADELIFIDIDAKDGLSTVLVNTIKSISEEIFMPITVGGGVRTLDDFRTLLSHGADKISINSAAVKNPELITLAAERFGSSTVVLSIDFKQNGEGINKVFIDGGKKETDLDPVEWALEGERRGAGEILLTSIDNDGMRKGLNNEIARKIADSVSIPVINSGGCGLARHFVEGFKEGLVNGISAGTYFCLKDENPMQTRSQVRNSGIPIRLHK